LRVVLLLLFAAAACEHSTLLYKSGSTVGDYQTASDRCRREGNAENPNFDRCMQAQGWSARQLGAPAEAGAANTSIPVAQPSPIAPSAPVAGDDTESAPTGSSSPVPRSKPAVSDVSARAPKKSSPSTPPSAPSVGDAGESIPEGTSVTASPPAVYQAAPAPAATQGPVVVNNWFKLGGTADDLAATQQRCAAALGVAGGPAAPNSDTVSAEMLDCLRKEGWHPL
jgi:hypothetical protein